MPDSFLHEIMTRFSELNRGYSVPLFVKCHFLKLLLYLTY